MKDTDKNPARDFIAKRIDELRKTTGLTLQKASVRLGRNDAYLQQFVQKGVPAELHEEDRIELAKILEVDPELLRGPGRRKLRKWMVLHQDQSVEETSLKPSTAQLVLAKTSETQVEGLWLYRMRAQKSGGTIRILAWPKTVVPKELTKQVSDAAYALMIADDSMWPELHKDSIAFVDPKLIPRVNTTCVFRKIQDDSEALVRHIEEITNDEFKVFSYDSVMKNSKTKVKLETFLKKEWFAHVIIGNLFPPAT